jgi:rhodanese-related sulfurtransferase
MKKLSFYLLALLFVSAITFTSCKDDPIDPTDDPTDTTDNTTPDPDPAFDILTDYLSTNSMDLSDIIKYHGSTDIKFVAPPPSDVADVAAFIAKYHIIDIRSGTDFDAGHLEGAVNIAPVDGDMSGVLTEAANAGSKPILVVCYTGQTACFATALLRLYGYPDAQALKWGMSGWHSDFDKWSPNTGNEADGHANWTFDAAPANTAFDNPVLTETMTDGADLLEARVEFVASQGFKGKTPTDVLNNPTNYFINNYFNGTDYTGFGHINGAYRIFDNFTLAGGDINKLDPDADVITYCYTGQTSAVITAYLRVIGYDAFSLKFGMNGLWNLNPAWTANQWSASVPKDYAYEVTP